MVHLRQSSLRIFSSYSSQKNINIIPLFATRMVTFGSTDKWVWLTFLPLTFASMVAELLSGSRGKGVQVYFDHILIYGHDFDEHLILTDAVLIRLRSA